MKDFIKAILAICVLIPLFSIQGCVSIEQDNLVLYTEKPTSEECVNYKCDYDYLQKIHSSFKRSFVYMSDLEQYGVEDKWVVMTDKMTGDCEDYALTVQLILKNKGIDSKLRWVMTEKNTSHMVLEHNNLIIDNRYTFVMKRSELNYVWLGPHKNIASN